MKYKDLDLIAYLFYKGFRPVGYPIADRSGIRYVVFSDSPQIKQATFDFMGGNAEAQLLANFRKARSFLLDSPLDSSSWEPEQIAPTVECLMYDLAKKKANRNE